MIQAINKFGSWYKLDRSYVQDIHARIVFTTFILPVHHDYMGLLD